jgi:hypothetical protein
MKGEVKSVEIPMDEKPGASKYTFADPKHAVRGQMSIRFVRSLGTGVYTQ